MTDNADAASLLESLARARLGLLYLERRAREEGDKAAADALAARGASLGDQISDLRARAHAAWDAGARDAADEMSRARSALEKALKAAEARGRAADAAAQVLSSLDDLLALVF